MEIVNALIFILSQISREDAQSLLNTEYRESLNLIDNFLTRAVGAGRDWPTQPRVGEHKMFCLETLPIWTQAPADTK